MGESHAKRVVQAGAEGTSSATGLSIGDTPVQRPKKAPLARTTKGAEAPPKDTQVDAPDALGPQHGRTLRRTTHPTTKLPRV